MTSDLVSFRRESMMAEDRKPMDAEGWQRFKAGMAAHFIEPYRVLYVRTHNPTYALRAYRVARATKTDVPEWVLALFDQWAEALCVKRPKGAKAIAAALGLVGSGGGPSITAQAETQLRNLRIVQRVFELHDDDPLRDMLGIFQQVAEESALSGERVAGIWYELARGVKL